MNELKQLFIQYTHKKPESIIPLSGAGSNRKYFRLSDGENTSLIGVIGTSTEENKAFIFLANHFKSKQLPTPEVYAVSTDFTSYLQEDLGDLSLFEYIAQGRKTGNFSDEEKTLLLKTIQKLPDFQFKGAENLDFTHCYPQAEFDKRSVLWDLNYFKYCFLKTTGIELEENLLEDDFELLAGHLLKEKKPTLLYRDFQSRNVMIHHDEPYFIDFQGSRKGPVFYDVASFLWQAKAQYPQELKEELLRAYLSSLAKYSPVNEEAFRSELRYFVLFRLLQVLGAYGFRGYMEKKAHFIESIPPAILNLKEILAYDNGFTELPYLNAILNKLCNLGRFDQKENPTNELEIKVYSFSYKKGIPEDYSGNGGGYVFDCRAIDNPGKYEEYKQLTGLDKPVIDFLKKNGEITVFIDKITALADVHVARYLERGFTSLVFCFGCTGGQHRSVYSAQQLAEYLANKYPVKVILEHREQKIKEIIYKNKQP